jgi:hypothetical protein
MQTRHIDIRHDAWEDIPIRSFPEIPTMISDQERRYLYWLAKDFYQGQGSIVEVGTWLGGSTACLAAGLVDSGSAQQLFCYDNYVWMKGYEPRAMGIVLPEGGDFHPHFKRFIDARFLNVQSQKAQLSEIVWQGGPIEVLFLDAPKNRADMISAINAFFPSLIPGFSVVVFQDFFYSPAYEVPATVCALGDTLSLVHTVANSSTAAFRVERGFDRLAEYDVDYESLDLTLVIRRMSEMADMLPQTAGDFLTVSLAMLVHDKRSASEALNIIKRRGLGDVGSRRLRFLGTMSHIKKRYGALF